MVVMFVDGVNLVESAIDDASGGKCEYSDGYSHAVVGNATVAVGNGCCWIAPDLRAIKETIAKASHNHFGTLVGVRHFSKVRLRQKSLSIAETRCWVFLAATTDGCVYL